MPIVYQGKNEVLRCAAKQFSHENELQACITEYPDLVLVNDELAAAVIPGPYNLTGLENDTLLMTDSEGRLSIVKLKLAAHLGPRREILAQIFDMAMVVTNLSIEELDRAIDGRLEVTFRQFAADPQDEYEFNLRWQSCESYLSSGQVRVIVVTDQISPELQSAFEFLESHSKLDARMLTIDQFAGTAGERVYVPNIIVKGSVTTSPVLTIPKTPRPEFEHVIHAYGKIALETFEPKGEGMRYRTLSPDWWPAGIHYAFCDYGKEIGVEIHLDTDRVLTIADVLQSFLPQLAAIFPVAIVDWDAKWSRGRGRLRVLSSPVASAAEIVSAMKTLIKETWVTINKSLEELGANPSPVSTLESEGTMDQMPEDATSTVPEQKIEETESVKTESRPTKIKYTASNMVIPLNSREPALKNVINFDKPISDESVTPTRDEPAAEGRNRGAIDISRFQENLPYRR